MNGILFWFMFVAAMMTAGIASAKNRNPVGWFVIGALFPVLGIILATVLPPNPTPEQNV